MSVLDEVLAFNQEFVDSGEYAQFITNKFPERHVAILSCMDARMVELLPKALGLKNGDAKLIKNAGALVTHPFGSVMRSLLVGIYQLEVKEILVIAHMDCGMRSLHADEILNRAKEAGITQEAIDTLINAGIDLESWLKGFDNVEDSVRHTVSMIKKHPLFPKHIPVHGLVMHPATGKLSTVVHDRDAAQ
ncbi:beta-class carbonic anhydrase [Neisseria sp. Ec49-e6-T10]|uniref:beta-class carbonic anhydrase n=1 Tax=Neisseria sp. Ec49-e6-T10 TaxID=3140744 RepID=UPI003EBBE4C5